MPKSVSSHNWWQNYQFSTSFPDFILLLKRYLAEYGVDADSVKGYFPVSGQTATHYTIRKERGISFTKPIVDSLAPLNNVRVLNTKLMLITGDRRLELMARYEENLYLKSVLEGIGNKPVTIHELSGFDHGTVLAPAAVLIKEAITNDESIYRNKNLYMRNICCPFLRRWECSF